MKKRFKLGKLPKKSDSRNLQFSKYLKAGVLPHVPSTVDYSDKISQWGMMLNDTIGDCTIAAAGHLIEAWSDGKIIVPDPTIQSVYSAISGYDPVTGKNDNGCAELDVLNYWHNTGINNDKIGAFTEVDIKNTTDIKTALYLFNGLYIGVSLPESAPDEFHENVPWTIVPGSPVEGGHAIILVGFDRHYFYAVTWGAIVSIVPAWLTKYMDEAYAIISNDYFTGAKTAEGFDIASLTNDLKLIK